MPELAEKPSDFLNKIDWDAITAKRLREVREADPELKDDQEDLIKSIIASGIELAVELLSADASCDRLSSPLQESQKILVMILMEQFYQTEKAERELKAARGIFSNIMFAEGGARLRLTTIKDMIAQHMVNSK